MKKTVTILALIFLFNSLNITMVTAENSNLLPNSDFEIATAAGGAYLWYASTGWGEDKAITLVTEESGNKCVKLKTEESGLNPFISYNLKVINGAAYTLSVDIKCLSFSGKGPAFKYEFYDENNVTVEGYDSEAFGISDSQWHRVNLEFTVPENSAKLVLLARLYGQGEVYYDNIDCRMIENSACRTFYNTDNIFYYSDWESGSLNVNMNTSAYTTPSDAYIDCYIKKEGITIASSRITNLQRYNTYTFPVSALSILGEPYNVGFEYKNASGIILEEGFNTIYRYDRPGAIGTDRIYRVSGEPFYPVLAYHVAANDFQYCKQAGANVVQSFSGKTSEYMLNWLNDIQNAGLMSLVSLYTNMKPAAHPDNIEATREIVAAVKNHPAVFGYIVMDEPFLHDANAAELLELSYKTIRDIDPYHPVYLVESPGNINKFREAGKYCDAFAVDPYTGYVKSEKRTTYVAQVVKAANEAVNYKKPVYMLGQACNINGYTPSGNDERHMQYQALLEGAKGLGYYAFRSWEAPSYPHLWTLGELWDGIVSFAENEQAEVMRHFTLEEPNLYESNTDTTKVRVWQNGEYKYVLILSLSDYAQNVVIPVSGSGISLVGGADSSVFTMDESGLTVSLNARQAVLCKIIPDYSRLGIYKGCVILKKPESGTLNAKVFSDNRATLIIALYNDKKLLDINMISGSGFLQTSIEVENTGSYTVKAFYWNEMSPLQEAYVLTN